MRYNVKISACIDDFMLAATTDVPVVELDCITEDALAHFLELAKMGVISLAFEANNSAEV